MKIIDAKKAYTTHLDSLRQQKNVLTQMLHDSEQSTGNASNLDRVELSRQLSEIEKEYTAVQKGLNHISETYSVIYQNAALRQQSEDAIEGAKELGKILTIYRRIASGAEVPPNDERKLMEYSHELYFSAKAAAMLHQDEDKEYDSLWKDDERNSKKEKSPEEIADNTSIPVLSPELTAQIAKLNED